MTRGFLLLLAAVLVGRWMCADDEPHPPRVFATFNIEQFPKNGVQVVQAFAEMARLDAGVIAVQEIKKPMILDWQARIRLGEDWAFFGIETRPPDGPEHWSEHIGALVDLDVYAVDEVVTHEETRLGGRNKPTAELRLRRRSDGGRLLVFVVHFRSGGEERPTRAAQFAALGGILHRRARGVDTIVMGDFNATHHGDFSDLRALARGAKLHFATEALECSAFWERSDGCPTSRLDHILTSWPPRDVRAHGACEEGCAWRNECPIWRHDVSDHCPVTVAR